MTTAFPEPGVPNAPSRVDPKLLLIYSAPGIGKTESAATLPDSYMLVTKNSEGSGADFTTFNGANLFCYEDYGAVMPLLSTWLAAGKIKRVVLDTIDGLEAWCEDEETKAYKKSSLFKEQPISQSVYELAYGAGYNMVRGRIKNELAKLMAVHPDVEVLLLAHLRDKFLDEKEEQKVVAGEIALTGKIREIIYHLCDSAAYMFRSRTGELKLAFSEDAPFKAKNRCKHLRGKTLVLGKMQGETLVCGWRQVYSGIAAKAAAATPTPPEARTQ